MSTEEVSSKKTEFLRSFRIFETNVGHNPYDLNAKPYCIWDLMLNLDGELEQLISIPNRHRQGYVWRVMDESPAFSATITPLGTISEPHMDQTGSGTLLIELLGKKLFIVWPPTPRNLSWFSDKYGLFSGTIFEAALQRLESPYCLVLEQGEYHLLLPGHIHGVLSATNSAIAGVPIVHSNFKDEAMKVMKWESDLENQRRQGSLTEKRLADEIKRGLENDSELWQVLEKRDSRMETVA